MTKYEKNLSYYENISLRVNQFFIYLFTNKKVFVI